MELGTRLRQARLEAGLSQRQLCGEVITRNMLSQIENSSARPSMDTLRYLAGRLGKPIGYFLEEPTVELPNLACIEQARQAAGQGVLDALEAYQEPDPVFDRERWLLEALACLDMAQKALHDGQQGLAGTLLERAARAGARTPYYTPILERHRQFLCCSGGFLPLSELPEEPQFLLLLARAALEAGAPERCAGILEAVTERDQAWNFLRAEAYFIQKAYAAAAEHYRQAAPDPRVYARLETCCRELEDYKMAYFYACKQREAGVFEDA